MFNKKLLFELPSLSLSKKFRFDLPHLLFLSCAILTASIALFFILFIFKTAMPVFESQGFVGFITGTEWNYTTGVYGIRIFIYGTMVLTLVTLLLAVPVSLFTAIFLAEYAPNKLAAVIRPLIELLVGIPSVVYGIFGLYVLEDVFFEQIEPFFISNLGFISLFADHTPNTGTGLFLASSVLAVMILPTITALSEDAIRSVKNEYREASFALGSTHWETIKRVVLPAASGGILSSIVLGMMRAMGETMAIVMLFGNMKTIPSGFFSYGFAMTSKILNDIKFYASEAEPRSALFGIAAILFLIEMLFVLISRKIGGGKE
ncbi:phosphate ABC transporter permease subunit PstC [Methanolobus sp. ZRKC2]|uniref:phosphate ABC transporter permease subunit PstC n=1 Tax=Methanolobus sp. ZRKC2 TaxID=3125783 RepID=UPI00324DAAA1